MCIWIKCVGEICFLLSACVCVCVFSSIAQGRGKSFHFLDESLVDQKPRSLLLTPSKASLFLSSRSLTLRSLISSVHSPDLCCHFGLFPFFSSLNLTYFPSSPTTTSSSNYSSVAALQPFISLSLSTVWPLFPPLPTQNAHALLLQSQHFRSAVLCRQTPHQSYEQSYSINS